MANSKESCNIKNVTFNGKHALLPPKIPFAGISPSYVDYVPSSATGLKALQKLKEGNSYHQRTVSESLLLDEQPSWLDELLNEPETPIHRGGHRRSSSDSYAYVDMAGASNIDLLGQKGYKYRNMWSVPTQGSQEFDCQKDAWQSSFYADANVANRKNWAWVSSVNTANHSSRDFSTRENAVSRSTVTSSVPQEDNVYLPLMKEKQDRVESGQHDPKVLSETKDGAQPMSSTSENDTKRSKQQYAQRSRVRKLQYIAELERNVQALQTEGSEFSAELEFLNQQSLILGMENKTLKHRLESLAQEHLIKCLEHEVLEREIGRLRALYQQQQQQQPQSSATQRRSKSRDLQSHFSSLSLKQQNANSGHDSLTGQLHM